jgi:hypothetical protein
VPAIATAAGDAGDGFAAILGATDLTHLTPEQRSALGQLLSDSAGTLGAGVDAAGTILPQVAIGGLLQALGIAADPDATAGEGGPFAELRAAADEALPGAGPAVAALFGLLLPAGAADPARPAVPPGTAQEATPLAQLVSLAAGARGGNLPQAGDAASREEGNGEARRGHPLGALLEMIRAAGAAGSAYGTATAGSAGVPGAGEALAPDTALPPGLLAVLEARAPADAVERTDGADLARGFATALEATQGGVGRAGLGAAAEGQTARPGGPVSTAVAVPFGERGWERAFGERVVWLVGQQLQTAEVRLNPPHLGPVEVRLSLTGQEANLSFTVAHGATREAIEQAIPRLREMFADQQLQIVNVDVGQRDASSQASAGDRWGRAGEGPSEPRGRGGPADAELAARPRVGGLPGLVDEYA